MSNSRPTDNEDWSAIETAPSQGLILLLVEDASKERRVFVAEASHEDGVLVWMITTGWSGWKKLHSGWTAIKWQHKPQVPADV